MATTANPTRLSMNPVILYALKAMAMLLSRLRWSPAPSRCGGERRGAAIARAAVGPEELPLQIGGGERPFTPPCTGRGCPLQRWGASLRGKSYTGLSRGRRYPGAALGPPMPSLGLSSDFPRL